MRGIGMASRGRSIRKRERASRRQPPTPRSVGIGPEHASALKWGQIGQLILQERSVDMLKDAKQRFRDKFGREPGPDDPVFFDPDADTPRFHSAANVRAEVIDAMERAGIRPALIYAYAKTGLIVSETNRRLMSKRQLAEWNAAMDEYEQKPDRH